MTLALLRSPAEYYVFVFVIPVAYTHYWILTRWWSVGVKALKNFSWFERMDGWTVEYHTEIVL